MRAYHRLTPILLLFTTLESHAQERAGLVRGKVVVTSSGEAIEYANIVLLAAGDSSVVTGAATIEDGSFLLPNVPYGNYFLEIRIIGSRPVRRSVVLNQADLDLSTISIQPAAIDLETVEIEGHRSPVTYSIDKKVLNVDQLQTATSGTAADVLESVPSVTVDIEGNVSLRGSTNFTVLIDGRRTVMEAQEALQQIPASTIQNIEIITNPSAKFDPEGASGIINVILKKDQRAGVSAVANLNAGLDEKYGGDLLLNYRNEPFAVTFGIDRNRRNFPRTGEEQRTTTFGGNTLYSISNVQRNDRRTGFGLRGAVEYQLGTADVVTLSARYRERDGESPSTTYYNEWSEINPQRLSYRNITHDNRNGSNRSIDFSHAHTFAGNAHELLSNLSYRYGNSQDVIQTELFGLAGRQSGRRSTEFGPSWEIEGKMDYTLPLSTGPDGDVTSRLEAGYEGEHEDDDEGNGLYELDTATGTYILQPLFSHSPRSIQSQHAVYATYSNEWSGLGVQAGLRGEYTYRKISVRDLNNNFTVDEMDYFPTLHLSHKFAGGQQVMGSYSRRIDRPRGWYLEPFETWTDANNVRRGNPTLQSEYIDSYELGFQTIVGDAVVSTEAYYRINNNKIESLRSVYDSNVTLTTFENIGKDFSLGGELLINIDPVKDWNVNLMGNVFQYRIKGAAFGETLSRESFNWRTRMNNVIKLTSSTQLQFNFAYQGASVSVQGRREGVFSTDLAVRQDLLSKALSITFQVRDVLNTSKEKSTSEGLGFSSSGTTIRKAPMIMLNLRYNFNSTQDKKERDRPEGFEEPEED